MEAGIFSSRNGINSHPNPVGNAAFGFEEAVEAGDRKVTRLPFVSAPNMIDCDPWQAPNRSQGGGGLRKGERHPRCAEILTDLYSPCHQGFA